MASPTELSLDCKPHHSYSSTLLKSFADHHSDHTHTYNLEDFLSRLEEERLKIDAFKRELPLCMQLITNAMETSRQELEALRGKQGTETAILEEFIPLKHPTAERCGMESILSDKANWMMSAQLWSQTSSEETKPQSSTMLSCKEAEIGLGLDSKQRSYGGGAFLPFSKQGVPELGLASSEKQTREEKKCTEPENDLKRESSGKGGGDDNGGEGSDQGKETSTVSSEAKRINSNSNSNTTSSTTQNHRKARRCWSPDLHRRFVNALQMLGGSQVATPKQIRELMKVEGLTNDEVKSHLQKYRLHTRRPSPSPQAGGTPGPQLVVLGGIWVPSEYTTTATTAHTGAANALFSPHLASHAQLPHYCTTTPVPQDFYAAVPPQPQNHSLHHHNLNVYREMSSNTQRSPEYKVRGGGERSESIEDVKSESIESGENERERKRDW